MTILTVKHVTTYSYRSPVRLGEHRMMLVRATATITAPAGQPRYRAAPASAAWTTTSSKLRRDRRSSGKPRRLQVENNIILEQSCSTSPNSCSRTGPQYPISYKSEEMPDLARAIERHYPDPNGELDRWVRQFVNQGRPTEPAALLMT